MNLRSLGLALVLSALPLAGVGCSAPRASGNKLVTLQTNVAAAIDDFVEEDPGIQAWFDESYGYAIFPSVGKGGIGVGGAYGSGLVYEQSRLIGTTALTQATIGFQLGGQSYQQVIFFENKRSLDRFTGGNFEFAAQVSAVALTAGASADADFRDGMAIFTMENGGLMYEASVGGQKFSFRPVED
jgi:lipid-binding SYLF domain-containing protein